MLTIRRLVLNGFIYLVLTNALVLIAHAQTGNISGTVTDSSKRAVLVGAQVKIEGQAGGTTTDDSGRYLLLGLPVGPAKLTVSYLGLASSTLDVVVAAGVTVPLDASLSPPGLEAEVTVTSEPELLGQAR